MERLARLRMCHGKRLRGVSRFTSMKARMALTASLRTSMGIRFRFLSGRDRLQRRGQLCSGWGMALGLTRCSLYGFGMSPAI